MHYINENEDVLVSLEDNIPEGFYRIPSINSYWLSHVIANNSLFIASKCYSEAYKEFHEDTMDMTYCKWMETHGYKHLDSFCHIVAKKEIYEKAGKYRNYDMLFLACIYGGNYRGFNILKPFIIPKEYVIADYDQQKIESFIDNLKENKSISIN